MRIFTVAAELPFAGHPTLGTCHAWLAAGNAPRCADEVVQECAPGLIRVRRTGDGLAFAAPPLSRSGPVPGELRAAVVAALASTRAEIRATAWVDTGPGWLGVLIDDPDRLLELRCAPIDQFIGVAAIRAGGELEVRAFYPVRGGDGRGPGLRQPQRRARSLAAHHRCAAASVRRTPGRRARA